MTSRAACLDALQICEKYFREAEQVVPPAQWVPWRGGYNWRFVEKLPSQLLLQKMARQITGLRALDLLLLNGFLQEVGTLFRMLDEITEDITFIGTAISNGRWTPNHDAYMQYFWSDEEGDGQCPVRRKTIRAYVNRSFGLPDPSSADKVGRQLYEAYSDFAHARSSAIMAMMSGPPPTFHLDGIKDPVAKSTFIEQAPSYFFRGLLSVAVLAKVATSESVNDACYAAVRRFSDEHAASLF